MSEYKPNLTLADVQAYNFAKSLQMNEEVLVGQERVKFAGMMGNLVTLKVRGRFRYLKAGDPLLLELRSDAKTTQAFLMQHNKEK